MSESLKSVSFVMAVLLLPILSLYVLSGLIDFHAASYWSAIFWLAGFGLLALNTSHMLVCSIVALWPGGKCIPETKHSHARRTDVLYVVRNENVDLLFTTISTTLAGIVGSEARLWLLSNSDDLDCQSSERRLVQQLQEKFGVEWVSLFTSRRNPRRRKHICIHEWLEVHSESCYVVICDADTVLPAGAVEKLVCKAEHPDNAGIVLFQSNIRIVDADTRFARILSFGQEIAQRIYTTAHQRVFGRSPYYGSGCLIRAAAYRTLRVPDWVLSHDIWETVALEKHVGRIVYCGDVVTFGRFPHNLLDFLRRGRRWIFGTMETLPLLACRGIPLGTRFFVLLPIYLYMSQPLLLIWIAFGFVLSSSVGRLLAVQTFASAGSGYVHLEMSSCLVFTMTIVFGHRFTQCRTLREIGETALELAASIILCLNCIVYDSATVVAALVRRGRRYEWVSSEKLNRPQRLRGVARELWPSTVLGLAGAAAGIVYARNWALIASPFLMSFCLGIPVAYWTAQKHGGSRQLPVSLSAGCTAKT